MRSVRVLPAILLLVLARPVMGAEKFELDSAHSKIGFTATLLGVADVDGRFRDFDATILYDEADLTKSSITVIIKSASVDTADENRDRDLKGAAFFDAEKFPTIRFQSARVEKRGEGWVVIGSLTIRDVTKTVEIPFVWRQKKASDLIWKNQRIAFDGHLTLNRKDYGVVGPAVWNNGISDTVKIELNLSAEIPNYSLWNFRTPPGTKGMGNAMLELIDRDGIDAALGKYAELAKDTGSYHSAPNQLRVAGRKLLARGKNKEALGLLKLNASLYPNDSKAFDALGDAFVANGEREAAAHAFQRALELDPNDTGAIESLRAPPA
jgi:polyisoprenoid-binding protein YceI